MSWNKKIVAAQLSLRQQVAQQAGRARRFSPSELRIVRRSIAVVGAPGGGGRYNTIYVWYFFFHLISWWCAQSVFSTDINSVLACVVIGAIDS